MAAPAPDVWCPLKVGNEHGGIKTNRFILRCKSQQCLNIAQTVFRQSAIFF